VIDPGSKEMVDLKVQLAYARMKGMTIYYVLNGITVDVSPNARI